MQKDVILSLCANISILTVLALVLTRISFFRRMLLDQREGKLLRRSWRLTYQISLGLIFGLFCVISDQIGVMVTGAIPNSRVIGILSAGLLGGPVGGCLAAVIAALHRWLIYPERISTTACVLATIIQGILGSVLGMRARHLTDWKAIRLFLITMFAGAIHIVLVLLLVSPWSAAVDIVDTVILPMTIANSFGMVIFFEVFRSVFQNEDLQVASSISVALRTVEQCAPYLRNSKEHWEDSREKIQEVICRETGASKAEFLLAGEAADREAVDPEAFAAEICPADELSGLLILHFDGSPYTYRTRSALTSGIAAFLGSQMELTEAAWRKEELKEAELRVLQSQINPHFLFNALNTISFFCREKPEKARELLQTLSSYFRNMLRDMNEKVILQNELNHLKAYLELEKARFEERLSVEFDAEPEDCVCRVPNLILQPVVENAVRYGAMKREMGKVKITVRREEDFTYIDVEDNGPGISREIIERLKKADEQENLPSEGGGAGIGLLNVQRRLNAQYGRDDLLQFESGDWGTRARMMIPN